MGRLFLTADYPDYADKEPEVDYQLPKRLLSPFVNHPFPFEFGIFEVQKHRDAQASNIQVTEHLGDVGFVKSSDHFRIHYNFPVYDQVWDQLTDVMLSVIDWEFLLLRRCVPAFLKLKDKSSFIELFVQARVKLIQNRHGRTNDSLGDLLMNHG